MIRDMQVHYKSDKADWETPQDFFDAMNRIFQFDLDVCATPDNAKCDYYLSPHQDALLTSRVWRGRCWMNPPYGRAISKWISKARRESLYSHNRCVVCLVPSRTDTKWWQDSVGGASAVLFLRGRLKFEGAKSSAPFPSALMIFGEITPEQIDALRAWGWIVTQPAPRADTGADTGE